MDRNLLTWKSSLDSDRESKPGRLSWRGLKHIKLVIFLIGWRTGTYAARETAQPFQLAKLSVLGVAGKRLGVFVSCHVEEINLNRSISLKNIKHWDMSFYRPYLIR